MPIRENVEDVQALHIELEELQEESARDKSELQEAWTRIQESEEELQYLRQQLCNSLATQKRLVGKVQALQGQAAAGRTNGIVTVHRLRNDPLTKLTPDGRVAVVPPSLGATLQKSQEVYNHGVGGDRLAHQRPMARPWSGQPSAPTNPVTPGRLRPRSAMPSSRGAAATPQSNLPMQRPSSAVRSPTCGVEAEDHVGSLGRQGVATSFESVASRPASAWSRDGGPRDGEAQLAPPARVGGGGEHPPIALRRASARPASARPGPTTTPAASDAGPKAVAAGVLVDTAVQAAPTPWTRFYFREDLSKAGSGQQGNVKKGNQLFQHFDVIEMPPLEEGSILSTDKVMTEVLPSWVPDSYERLAYSRHRNGRALPAVSFKNASVDITKEAKLFTKDKKQVMCMAEFANFVARLLPRSNSDFECLRELQTGLLMHLVKESGAGKSGLLAELRASLREDFDNQMSVARRHMDEQQKGKELDPLHVTILNRVLLKLQSSVHMAWSNRKTQEDVDLNLEVDEMMVKLKNMEIEAETAAYQHGEEVKLLNKRVDARDEIIAELNEKLAHLANTSKEEIGSLKSERAKLTENVKLTSTENTQLQNTISELNKSMSSLTANLNELQEELNATVAKAESDARKRRAEAASIIDELETALEVKKRELEEAHVQLTKLNVTEHNNRALAQEERIKRGRAMDETYSLQEELDKLKQELMKSNVTGNWQTAEAEHKYKELLDEFEKYKRKMGDDLRAQRAEHALKEEEMQQAAEEERLRLEIELHRTRETQSLQLKHKEQALAEMSEKLKMLNDSLRSVQEAEESSKLQATLASHAHKDEDGPLLKSPSRRTIPAVFGKNASDPEYLNWLFSSEGALKDPMDYGQFVYVAHQYMVYMRRTFGIECMVSVIGYDSKEDPAEEGEGLDDHPSNYDDNIFRVVATTPQMSQAAQSQFQDAGSVLPRDTSSCHYVACNTGKPVTWENLDLNVSLRCETVPIPLTSKHKAKGLAPAFGTILFLIPNPAFMGEDMALQKANLMHHVPTHVEAMYGATFSGKKGLGRAAEMLGAFEVGVVQRTRKMRRDSPPKQSLTVEYQRLRSIKHELEQALLKTTLNNAMNELKRYRRPADTVVIVLLGTLLLTKDEHVQPFMENLEFALGPRGANQLSYIWVVARAKLITGSKKGSLVNTMRNLEYMDPAVGVESIQQMSAESKVLDRMIHHWAKKILDRVDDHSAENASKVLHVLREWMVVVTNLHQIMLQMMAQRDQPTSKALPAVAE